VQGKHHVVFVGDVSGAIGGSISTCATLLLSRQPEGDLQFSFSNFQLQNLPTKMVKGKELSQGKEKVTTLYRKRKHKGDRNGDGKRAKVDKVEKAGNVVTNVDHLQWKKISLNNDEFEDLEEIEGVDVEYVEKDESKVVQFKVYLTWELN
jgi:hypothetical protein